MQGPQGLKGEKGDQGDKGEKGDKGDKGDTGKSAVYIGTTEPTDPDIMIWIKPDGESIAVVNEEVM